MDYTGASTMAKPHILLAEREKTAAKDLKQSLERLGYRVSASQGTASDTINRTLRLKPDLVLMEIETGDNHAGLRTAAQIRKKADVPVILLVSRLTKNLLKSAQKMGSFGFLVKPFREPELLNSIENALDGHRGEKRIRDDAMMVKRAFQQIQGNDP
jgi:DNA-binding response OmpR family regulator